MGFWEKLWRRLGDIDTAKDVFDLLRGLPWYLWGIVIAPALVASAWGVGRRYYWNKMRKDFIPLQGVDIVANEIYQFRPTPRNLIEQNARYVAFPHIVITNRRAKPISLRVRVCVELKPNPLGTRHFLSLENATVTAIDRLQILGDKTFGSHIPSHFDIPAHNSREGYLACLVTDEEAQRIEAHLRGEVQIWVSDMQSEEVLRQRVYDTITGFVW